MKRTRFYSLDFSYSLRHHLGTISAGVWFAVLLVILGIVQYGIWFSDEYHKPTLEQRIKEFDEIARPVAELNEDWKTAIKRYEPLYTLMAAEDEVPVLGLLEVLDGLVEQRRSGATAAFRPSFVISGLVIERGRGAMLRLTLLLPDTDRQDYFSRSVEFFREGLASATVLDAHGGTTNKVNVALSWDKGGEISPETASIEGTLNLSVPKSDDIAKFPPVANDVIKTMEIVGKWQKRVEEYKFVKRTPWYKKPLEWYSGTSGGAVAGAVDFSTLIGHGKDVPEFERARKVHVNPLMVSSELMAGLAAAIKKAEGNEAAKKAKSKMAEAKKNIDMYEGLWREMAAQRSPYRREKAFNCRELGEDAELIRGVAQSAPPRISYVRKCKERADLHYAAIGKGVQYKHVFEETTFRDRVMLPPVQKALEDAGAKGWTAGFDGVKKEKTAGADKSPILFPEWAVGAGADNSLRRGGDSGIAEIEPAPFDVVRQAVANVEASEARTWVTRVAVEFAQGSPRASWPPAKSFTLSGRVPCWRDER